MNNIYKEFGKRLAELRKAQKLTQSEVAAKLNTVQSTYSGYELGTRKVTIDTIIALANFFDVSPDYLILGGSLLSNNRNGERHSQVSGRKAIVDMIKEQYGKTTCEAFSMYVQLDSDDQGEIRGEMKHMLRSEKYLVQEELRNA